MKKHTLIPALVAALLCFGATTMTACTDTSTELPKDTGSDTADVTESATDPATDPATESETDPETDPATDPVTDSATDPETDPGTDPVTDSATDPEAESETEPETDSETDPETEPETDSETEPETEAVTAIPRYDYMEAEVLPDVTITADDYKGLTLVLPVELQITQEAVLDYIDYLCFEYRTATNGTEHMTDQPMKLGDDAFIYYKGFVDGVEFSGGSNWDSSSPYQLSLGSGAFIPGFEEGLVGVIPAEATKDTPFELHVTFPDNYNAELAGKEAVFHVAVEYAVQYEIPAYDRDFVENVLKYEGEKDFYTDRALLDEFEAYIRAWMEEEIAADVENAKIDALWSHLVDSIECRNLPESEITFYYDSYLSEIEYYYEYYSTYGGSEFTDLYPDLDSFGAVYMGVEAGADWHAELSKTAERMVKRDMVLHAIAELEGMETVTDEEYQAEIDYWVSYYSGYMTAEEIEQTMGEVYLRESALSEKMQAWLLEQATFTFEPAAE